MPINNTQLSHIVNTYLSIFPNEKENLKLLLDQLSKPKDLVDRKNFVGHITASGFVLDRDRRKVLMIRHIALDKLLQPGGHLEVIDESPLEGAIREIIEETGVADFKNLEFLVENPNIPIDINTHFIPENIKKQEPAHFHHDFRYCFVLKNHMPNLINQLEEVSECKFVELSVLSDLDKFGNVYKKVNKLILGK